MFNGVEVWEIGRVVKLFEDHSLLQLLCSTRLVEGCTMLQDDRVTICIPAVMLSRKKWRPKLCPESAQILLRGDCIRSV